MKMTNLYTYVLNDALQFHTELEPCEEKKLATNMITNAAKTNQTNK